MRMRRKKHLESRIDNTNNYLLAREGYDFYKTDATQRDNQIDFPNIFGNSNQIYLEIGCGKGQFAITMAQQNPSINFVVVEKLSNVIVEACEKAQQAQLDNVRFLNCGAENLLHFIPPHSISRIYLNFSCPYPKHTYANRRLTYKSFLAIYKVLLKDDGDIMLKTDNKDFFNFSVQQLSDNGFTLSELTDDLHNSIYVSGNVITEYEQKFLDQGLPIHHLKATKKI